MMHEREEDEKEKPERGVAGMVWVDDSGASESQSPHKDVFVRMKKAIVDEGLTTKELKAGMDKEIEALKSFNTYTWVSPKEGKEKG